VHVCVRGYLGHIKQCGNITKQVNKNTASVRKTAYERVDRQGFQVFIMAKPNIMFITRRSEL